MGALLMSQVTETSAAQIRNVVILFPACTAKAPLKDAPSDVVEYLLQVQEARLADSPVELPGVELPRGG